LLEIKYWLFIPNYPKYYYYYKILRVMIFKLTLKYQASFQRHF